VVARKLVYAAWFFAVVALAVAPSNERIVGALLVPASALLLGAAKLDIGAELGSSGRSRFLNFVTAAIAVIWLCAAIALLI
jgi:hypothetical protein